MSRTRVKICGITNVEDARLAVRCGADAIGVIMYPPSPRCADIEAFAEIRRAVPAFVTLTLVSVDLDRETHNCWIKAGNPDILQFHGEESPEHASSFNLPYIKSLRMRDDVDIAEAERQYGDAKALLLDTYVAGTVGGTGKQFDWRQALKVQRLPVVLAGGLDATNIGSAIDAVQPFAVDVSSSLEAEPGIKNHQAMREFFDAVHTADSARNF